MYPYKIVHCDDFGYSEYSDEDIYTEDDANELDFLDDIFNIRY